MRTCSTSGCSLNLHASRRRADFDNERLPHYGHPVIDNGANHHAPYGATFVSPSSRQRSVEHTLKLLRQAMHEDREFA